jgi:hypothetical protein
LLTGSLEHAYVRVVIEEPAVSSDDDGRPTPAGHDAEVLRAFLEQARALADWHRQRAEEAYKSDPQRTNVQVVGMLADQLIRGGPGEADSPIDTIAVDAKTRGEWVYRSIVLVLIGLALLAATAAILLIEVAAR